MVVFSLSFTLRVFYFILFYLFFRATSVACRGSQARGQIGAVASGLCHSHSNAVSCGVGRRRSLDPVLLWLWGRPAATALMRPLAWKPPCATGVAQEMAKTPKRYVNK